MFGMNLSDLIMSYPMHPSHHSSDNGDRYLRTVHPKKSLGQHFLIAPDVARRMAEALDPNGPKDVLEVGPGKGAVTRFLIGPHPQALSQGEGRNLTAHHRVQGDGSGYRVHVVDLDKRMCDYIAEQLPQLRGRILNRDFLELDFDLITDRFQLIGSFPYNISSQIVFRMLENRERIPVMVGMFQREVAKRIVSPHGNKDYGILSVLTQTFYDTELLFNVKPGSFSPPPKVMSSVIRLRLKPKVKLKDEEFFFRVVKAAFNQRRKMLRNSLAQLIADAPPQVERFLTKRPEQLTVQEFRELAEWLKPGT